MKLYVHVLYAITTSYSLDQNLNKFVADGLNNNTCKNYNNKTTSTSVVSRSKMFMCWSNHNHFNTPKTEVAYTLQ